MKDGSSALDFSFLESLLGYHARRVSLHAIDLFAQAMAKQDVGDRLKVVEFSVLSLIAHNNGITSRQICNALAILPPNLVGMIQRFEKMGWVQRRPHPVDGRALGLHLSADGERLIRRSESILHQVEAQVAPKLTDKERKQLIKLLLKAYPH